MHNKSKAWNYVFEAAREKLDPYAIATVMFLKEYGTIEQTGYVIESDSTALEMYENATVLYYTMCAEHGNIPAMLALARIYKEGLGSIEKDEQKSTRYFFMSGIGRN